MEILPVNTPLGDLTMKEVYYSFDGPKLFSCYNSARQCFITFFLGEYLDSTEWLYLPVSDQRLELIKSGELSLYKACMTSELGMLWLLSITEFEKDVRVQCTHVPPNDLSPEQLPRPAACLPRLNHF